MNNSNLKSVPAEVYTTEYYLDACEGSEEFLDSKGAVLSDRLERALTRLAPAPGDRILDVGCGRGELLLASARMGGQAVGIDYARDALVLTRQALAEHDAVLTARTSLARSNAKFLPFGDMSFDKVAMLDIVEHLYPHELDLVMQEVRRVLKRDGLLVVHTAPNRWFLDFGYRYQVLVTRLLQPLAGLVWGQDIRRPKEPRQKYARVMHVNEQTVVSLRRALLRNGFDARVWVEGLPPFEWRMGRILWMTLVYLWPLSTFWPLKTFFAVSVWALARPSEGS